MKDDPIKRYYSYKLDEMERKRKQWDKENPTELLKLVEDIERRLKKLEGRHKQVGEKRSAYDT